MIRFFRQDLYYNPNTKKGYLANKFSNARNNNNDSFEMVEATIADDLSNEQKENYAHFFRYCVAKKQTKEIKEKLRESAPYRTALLQYFGQNFKQYCQFYFDMPELVGLNLH